MSEMEQFFTRQAAQEGKKVPLSRPDGSETGHWILLRGVDSDAYQEAFAKERKRLLESLADGSKDNTDDDSREIKLIAALIAGWSFDNEFTPENVEKFLREAPQIRTQLDRLSADRKYFFGNEGKDSASSQGSKPSSPNRSQKKQK